MREKQIPKPAWYKNTYFWISGLLVIVAIVGVVFGQDSIRDPGQKHENGLVLMYLGGAAIMAVNGWLSHRQTVLHYNEQMEKAE